MSSNTGNTILGLLTGAVIGAGLGLLYAPQSGKETREQLLDEANKAKDKLGREYDNLSHQITDYANTAKGNFEKKVDSLFRSANNEADEILAGMESELEELRKKNAKLEAELNKLQS